MNLCFLQWQADSLLLIHLGSLTTRMVGEGITKRVTWWRWLSRETEQIEGIYYKELVYMLMEAGKSKICGVGVLVQMQKPEVAVEPGRCVSLKTIRQENSVLLGGGSAFSG